MGDAVDGWSAGDRVMAMGRGYAELAVVDAALAAPVPAGLGWSAAGALPVAAATMHDALVTNGGFRAAITSSSTRPPPASGSSGCASHCTSAPPA